MTSGTLHFVSPAKLPPLLSAHHSVLSWFTFSLTNHFLLSVTGSFLLSLHYLALYDYSIWESSFLVPPPSFLNDDNARLFTKLWVPYFQTGISTYLSLYDFTQVSQAKSNLLLKLIVLLNLDPQKYFFLDCRGSKSSELGSLFDPHRHSGTKSQVLPTHVSIPTTTIASSSPCLKRNFLTGLYASASLF